MSDLIQSRDEFTGASGTENKVNKDKLMKAIDGIHSKDPEAIIVPELYEPLRGWDQQPTKTSPPNASRTGVVRWWWRYDEVARGKTC